MDIKKLGLASTIAVLSVTVALGGCDLFKSPEQLKAEKIAREYSIFKEKASKCEKAHSTLEEAEINRNELQAQLFKKYNGSVSDYIDNEEFIKRCNEVIEARKELDKVVGETAHFCDKHGIE